MLFAILDKMQAIDVKHLEAALAWVAYWSESVDFVFATADEQRTYRRSSDNAAKVLAWLAGCPEVRATRTSINKECFSGHLSSDKLDDLLRGLAADGKVVIRQGSNADQGRRKTTFVSLPC